MREMGHFSHRGIRRMWVWQSICTRQTRGHPDRNRTWETGQEGESADMFKYMGNTRRDLIVRLGRIVAVGALSGLIGACTSVQPVASQPTSAGQSTRAAIPANAKVTATPPA